MLQQVFLRLCFHVIGCLFLSNELRHEVDSCAAECGEHQVAVDQSPLLAVLTSAPAFIHSLPLFNADIEKA